jgi:hypothetical protein
MRDIHKITVSTKSTEPLSAVVEIDTADSTMKFELNEDMAHDLCANLDRFLTQRRHMRAKIQRG